MITLKENIPLAPLTSFGIGGPARYFVTAASTDELRDAVLFARRRGLACYLIGGGTNLIVSDAGFDGLIIQLKFDDVRRAERGIRAEAGADLTGLVRQAANWGLSGMEPLAGIPGMLGGALRGNAGAYGSCIGEVCAAVRVLNTESLEFSELSGEECRFDYRESRFKRDPKLIVVSALLTLSPGVPEEIRGRVEATIAQRIARNLQCEKSAGSFFMNPLVLDPGLIKKFESDRQVRCRDGRIPAGWLIELAGLRGQRVGAAMVSSLHANYLVNTGGASAEEIVALARLIKERVRAATGVQLQEEASRLGFPPAEAPGTSA